MAFKQGTTPMLIYSIDDLDVSTVQEVIFTITSEAGKKLDPIEVVEPETNTFMIGLTQEQTMQLQGSSQLEAQINFKDKHQEKTVLDYFYVNDTLGTKVVEGNKPAAEGGVERILERIKGDVAWIVTPEASEELLEAVTGLFNATKEEADSVRQDADAGVFDGEDGQDGEDGFSPQVTVKTETPSTYILHIKDADHEFDTPNLQGQGGGSSIEVGDGLQKVGNVIGLKLSSYLYGNKYLGLSQNQGEQYGLYLNFPSLISDGVIVNKSYADNLANALGNALSISIDSQTYVMTMQLKHNNEVLSTGTVDLPLETMVVGADYDSQTKEIVLTLQSGSTVRFSVADLVSGLQTEITAQNKLDADYIQDGATNKPSVWNTVTDKANANNVYTKTEVDTALGNKQDIINAQNKLDADLVDDTSSDNKFVTLTDIIAWNNKQEPISQNNKLDADLVDDSTSTNKFVSASEKSKIAEIDDKQDQTDITTDTSSTTVSLTLADNHEYRYTQDLTSLTLTMPSGDFIASIVFASGSTPTSMTYDSSIKWSGNDVSSNAFVPQANQEYEIVFWYNGLSVNAVVRGVA